LMTMLAVLLLPLFHGFSETLNIEPLPVKLSCPLAPASTAAVDVSVNWAQISPAGPETGKTGFFSRFWQAPASVKSINIFGIVWGMGFVFLLLRFIAGLASIHTLKKGLKEVTAPRLSRLMQNMEKTFSGRLRTQVYTSSQVNHPMAIGIFKPFILIPECLLDKLQDRELRGILLHELSHIHHRDQVAGVIQRFVTALNWWNPFAYALSSMHSKAREEISDNHVLLQNNSRDYAECLIDLAEKVNRFKRVPVSAGLASSHLPLAERVKHILSKERIMDTNLKKSSISVIVLAAFLVLSAAAGSRLTFATSKNEPVRKKAETEFSLIQEKEQPKQTQENVKSDKRDIKPPKLIKKVEPVYPAEAREAGIEGLVTLEAATDKYGRVESVKVLKSVPGLDQAAIDAVRQWVYEPMVIDGQPHGVVFTVTCRFSLEEKSGESIEEGVVGTDQKPAARAVGDIKSPKLIKKVEPVYPAKAKKDGIEGVVILEATTDIYGRVVDTRVLKSVPELDQAAIDAVKQWVYEPEKIDGVPRGMVFTVTCTFKLKESVQAQGNINAPKLIKKVEPIYPEEAKKAKVGGVVILEVTTDIYGKVVKTDVEQSVPQLDQAAIDAVKQWVYEPKIVDGKPEEATFYVTVTFKIK
jgi:TonB family protein